MLLCTILPVRANGTQLSTLTLSRADEFAPSSPSMRKPGCGARMIIGRDPGRQRMAPRRADSLIENFLAWFAASVLVTAGVIYASKPEKNRRGRQPAYVLPRATP